MVHVVETTHARLLDCLDRSSARTGRWNALERVSHASSASDSRRTTGNAKGDAMIRSPWFEGFKGHYRWKQSRRYI